MFESNWKKLHSFVTKLHLKLQENADRYSTEWNKMNYAMFWLEKDIISTVNFFYHNDSFSTITVFIVLLEQTYDDVSHEYTAIIKLEILQQRNCKFTSFFFKFLSLINELNWNESAKIAALQHAIFNKICAQLVIQKMLRILSKFAILYQQIDENFWYNQFIWFWKTNMQFTRMNMFSRNMIIITHNSMNIDNTQFYTSADSDEWKNHITKSECFDYNQKKHWHKNCFTNSYNKIHQITAFNKNSQLTS